jgi:Polyketide cyclase / dehydrase and lipid transport
VTVVRAERRVALDPDRARRLWLDVSRWPSFVEGFTHPVELSPDWPAPGARVVWRSSSGARGRVTERVVEAERGGFATEVFDEQLHGRRVVLFAPAPDGAGARAALELSYELSRSGPLAAVTDALVARRARRDALRRTLRRFAIEAEEETRLM